MSTECFEVAAAGFRRVFQAAAAAAILAACAPAGPFGTNITELSGSSWRVALVNGRPTPATGDYSMRFQQREVGVRLGCNHMGGRYALRGDLLTLSDFAQTLMGCPEPASTFETQGSAVLAQPMRIAFDSNDRMFLSNAAGSITLEPIP